MYKTSYFKDLTIGQKFYCHGNTCTKKSSRTAWIGNHSWFYYGMMETVLIEKV